MSFEQETNIYINEKCNTLKKGEVLVVLLPTMWHEEIDAGFQSSIIYWRNPKSKTSNKIYSKGEDSNSSHIKSISLHFCRFLCYKLFLQGMLYFSLPSVLLNFFVNWASYVSRSITSYLSDLFFIFMFTFIMINRIISWIQTYMFFYFFLEYVCFRMITWIKKVNNFQIAKVHLQSVV